MPGFLPEPEPPCAAEPAKAWPPPLADPAAPLLLTSSPPNAPALSFTLPAEPECVPPLAPSLPHATSSAEVSANTNANCRCVSLKTAPEAECERARAPKSVGTARPCGPLMLGPRDSCRAMRCVRALRSPLPGGSQVCSHHARWRKRPRSSASRVCGVRFCAGSSLLHVAGRAPSAGSGPHCVAQRRATRTSGTSGSDPGPTACDRPHCSFGPSSGRATARERAHLHGQGSD